MFIGRNKRTSPEFLKKKHIEQEAKKPPKPKSDPKIIQDRIEVWSKTCAQVRQLYRREIESRRVAVDVTPEEFFSLMAPPQGPMNNTQLIHFKALLDWFSIEQPSDNLDQVIKLYIQYHFPVYRKNFLNRNHTSMTSLDKLLKYSLKQWSGVSSFSPSVRFLKGVPDNYHLGSRDRIFRVVQEPKGKPKKKVFRRGYDDKGNLAPIESVNRKLAERDASAIQSLYNLFLKYRREQQKICGSKQKAERETLKFFRDQIFNLPKHTSLLSVKQHLNIILAQVGLGI